MSVFLAMLLSPVGVQDAHAGPGRFLRIPKSLRLDKARRLARGARVTGALAGLAVTERAARGFAEVGPELGRNATFLAREQGTVRALRHLDGHVRDVPALPDEGAVLLDPTAAVDPDVLDGLLRRDVFVLDSQATLHRADFHDGRFEIDGLDLLSFAADQLEPEEHELGPVHVVVPLVGAAGFSGFIAIAWIGGRRKREQRIRDREALGQPLQRYFCERCLAQYPVNHGDCPSCPEEPLLDLKDRDVVELLKKFDEQAWRKRMGQVSAGCALVCSPLLLLGAALAGGLALPVYGFVVISLSTVIYPVFAVEPRTPARLRLR